MSLFDTQNGAIGGETWVLHGVFGGKMSDGSEKFKACFSRLLQPAAVKQTLISATQSLIKGVSDQTGLVYDPDWLRISFEVC